jgi:hypothetical protein
MRRKYIVILIIVLFIAGVAIWALNSQPPPSNGPFYYSKGDACIVYNPGYSISGAVHAQNGVC